MPREKDGLACTAPVIDVAVGHTVELPTYTTSKALGHDTGFEPAVKYSYFKTPVPQRDAPRVWWKSLGSPCTSVPDPQHDTAGPNSPLASMGTSTEP